VGGRRPYPFHDGVNVVWDLVVWRGDDERVEVAVLSREDIARVRGCFERGDDAWMYDVYSVPNAVLPKIADLVPGLRLDPELHYYIETRQDLQGGEIWVPERGDTSPGL
jgi:hypothetical protein